MNIRKDPLATGNYYHIYNRSIAKFVIFNNNEDYGRFMELLNLCRFADFDYKYSKFVQLDQSHRTSILENLYQTNNFLVEIVAYCLMPTHFHLLLKQVSDDGISKFMAKVQNSYTRYFNVKHHRHGPLYESHFKDVLVKTDEQLWHVTRYFHLNATSAGIVKKPEDWAFSSYGEYLDDKKDGERAGFCQFRDLFTNFDPKQYQEFVNDRQAYQRELGIIKKFLIDNYSG